MSNNLLITLGDSWTEGVGCYLPELLDPASKNIPYEVYIKSKESGRFKELGWPRRVADKINFDLLNLGEGGHANSSMVKMFLNFRKEYEKLKDKYDNVIVIFLVTDPFRFSFFSNGVIETFSTRGFLYNHGSDNIDDKSDVYKEDFLKWYLSNVNVDDATKETSFYLKCIENFCELHGYKFYWGTAFTDVNEIIKYYPVTNCLNYGDFKSYGHYISEKLGTEGFAACHHPNEDGYELIAQHILGKIEKDINILI
jgi:hypothetical protein